MASTHKLASPNAHVMGFLLVSASSLLGDLPIGFPIIHQLLVWAAMILLNVGTTFFFSASRSVDLCLLFFLFSFSRCQKSSRLGFFSLFLAARIVCQPKTVGGGERRLRWAPGQALPPNWASFGSHGHPTIRDRWAMPRDTPWVSPFYVLSRLSQNAFLRTLNQKDGQQISQDSTYKCRRDISCWISSP